MKNIIRIIILLFYSLPIFAGNTQPLNVEFQGKNYQLILSKGQLSAMSDNKKFEGNLDKRLGDFSQWTFTITKNDDGFNIILNEKNNKIITLKKTLLEAGGPFLEAISPDSKLVVLDYGTGPEIRDFAVRTADGKLLITDKYINQVSWTKNGLEYEYPVKRLPISLNAQTKACKPTLCAMEVQYYVFNGRDKIKMNKPMKIQCCQ